MTQKVLQFLNKEIKANEFINKDISIENNIATVLAFKNTMAIKFLSTPANMGNAQLDRFLQAKNIEGYGLDCSFYNNKLTFSNDMQYKMLPFKQSYVHGQPIDFTSHRYSMVKVGNDNLLKALKQITAVLDCTDMSEETGDSVATQVYFEIKEDELNIICTDGIVLSKHNIKINEQVENMAKHNVFSVSSEHIAFISKMANETSRGNLYANIYIAHDTIDFSFGSLRFIVDNHNDITRQNPVKRLMAHPTKVFDELHSDMFDKKSNELQIKRNTLSNIINKISAITQSTHSESHLFNFVNFKNGVITGYHQRQDTLSIKANYGALYNHDINIDVAVMQAVMQNANYKNFSSMFYIVVGEFEQNGKKHNSIYMNPDIYWDIIIIGYNF